MIVEWESDDMKVFIPARTRPEYDLRCQECGSPHWLDTSLPIEMWNKIARSEDIFCLLCIDDKMKALDLTCEVEFYFVGKAVASKLYGKGSIRSRWETWRRFFLRLKDGFMRRENAEKENLRAQVKELKELRVRVKELENIIEKLGGSSSRMTPQQIKEKENANTPPKAPFGLERERGPFR